MAGGAGRHEHLPRGQLAGADGQVELPLLGLEQDAVLGFLVNLDLRVVGPHVTLAAGPRQAGDLDGGRVPRVAGGAGADGAVLPVRLADVEKLDGTE